MIISPVSVFEHLFGEAGACNACGGAHQADCHFLHDPPLLSAYRSAGAAVGKGWTRRGRSGPRRPPLGALI